jgi:hypothetical protein
MASPKVAEAYAKIQAASSPKPEGIAEEVAPNLSAEYQVIVSALNDSEEQLLGRIRALAIVGEHGSNFDKPLAKAAMQSIVEILGETDDSKSPDLLLTAAINAFVNMCKNTQTKQEDVVRTAADLCIQIILNKEGYSAAIRQTAQQGLDQLTDANFAGVAKKLLHLVSDNREKDETAQLDEERAFALRNLRRLARDAKYAKMWTEEIIQLLSFVFLTATAEEMGYLCSVAFDTPIVKENGGVVVLDAILGGKMDSSRLFESLAIIAPFIPKTTKHDAVAEKVIALLVADKGAAKPAPKGKKSAAKKKDAEDDEVSKVLAAKALVLAARTASDEESAKLVAVVMDQLLSILPSTVEETPEGAAEEEASKERPLPENLTQLEAILYTTGVLGLKCAPALMEVVGDAAFAPKCLSLHTTLEHYKKVVEFSVKKKTLEGEKTTGMQELLTTVTNSIALLGPYSTGHLPSIATFTPSWEKLASLPAVKKPKQVNPNAISAALGAKTARSASNGPKATKGARAETPNKNRNNNGNKNGNSNGNKRGGADNKGGKGNQRGGRRF